MAEQMEREEEAKRQRELMDKISRYRSMGFADTDMRFHTFAVDDGTNPKITKAMQAYVENFKEFRKTGKGLLLYGPVGTGKSFFAACVCNALIDKGFPCLMTNFSRLTNVINGADWDEKQSCIDSLTRFSLIAIDDLGVERDTEFMNESVTTIIDSLYRAKVPVIITSNYAPRQLTDEGDIRRRRVYDRLLERCHPVEITGESRRKQKGREDYTTMRNILGV
jgi:DNA replication protein DnaC